LVVDKINRMAAVNTGMTICSGKDLSAGYEREITMNEGGS